MIFAFNDNDSLILITNTVISNPKVVLRSGEKKSFLEHVLESRKALFYYKDLWKKREA